MTDRERHMQTQYQQRDAVADAVDVLVVHVADIPSRAACVYYAALGACELRRRGVAAEVQGGSMSWPMIDEAQDDGIRPTHFSYLWEDEPAKMRMAAGELPEMHCWIIAGLEYVTLIDFSTGHLPAQAKELCGYDWPGARPPRYLWASRVLPARVVYQPNRTATAFARMLAASISS